MSSREYHGVMVRHGEVDEYHSIRSRHVRGVACGVLAGGGDGALARGKRAL